MLKLSINIMLGLMDEGQRPPNNEVAAALNAVAAFIGKATEEPKLQTILDEVRKLANDSNERDTHMDEKITHIRHQAASKNVIFPIPSYASVLNRSAGGVPPPFLSSATSKQGQYKYNKANEIVVKLHDEAVNKALEGKTPGEMTTMIN